MRGVAEHTLHHGLSALGVKQAPYGLRIDNTHLVDHIAVREEIGHHAVTCVHRFLDRFLVAEDHGGLVEEDDAHAVGAHGVDAVVAEHDGLGFGLGEAGHDLACMELALRDADDASSLPLLITEGGKGEHVSVLIDFEAGALESCFEALEFGRKNPVLEFHGCGGVLHGMVVDHDELLNVFGDR